MSAIKKQKDQSFKPVIEHLVVKNNWFDKSAKKYKAARPEYPDELFNFLSEKTENKGLVVDCGAGSGQATLPLSKHFREAVGIDVGANMLENAPKAANIKYLLSSTSSLPFEANSVDLITSATAAHWFNLDEFYSEVNRVLKPGGVLALWSYYMPKVSEEIDAVVKHVFEVELDEYVDERRQWIIDGYDSLPFPYEEEKEKKTFDYSITADFNRFTAVLESSSLVKRRIEATGINPIDEVRDELKKLWGKEDQERKLTWNHNMVIAKKPKLK